MCRMGVEYEPANIVVIAQSVDAVDRHSTSFVCAIANITINKIMCSASRRAQDVWEIEGKIHHKRIIYMHGVCTV